MLLKVILRWIIGEFTLYILCFIWIFYINCLIFLIIFKNTNYNLEKQKSHFPEIE